MNDSGLHHIFESLLRLSKADGRKYISEKVGDNYRDLVERVHERWKDDRRSLQANALLHLWFAQIAKHKGDMTASEVKGECHRRWGLSIRLRNNRFAWIWSEATANLNYEQQHSVLESGIFQISSGMTTKELTEYMNEIETHYRAEGVRLTEPEATKCLSKKTRQS